MKQTEKISLRSVFLDGIIFKNPALIQLLGMCPLLATTTSVVNGLGMGAAFTFVLVFSNLVISLLRKFIPYKIRIASYIVVIAGFVTIVDMLLQAFLPSVSQSLGLFIPLIVVNCVILARAESFASKNKPLPSIVDGFGMGIGYTLALLAVSFVRELLGNGSVLGFSIPGYEPALLFIMPAGGFLVLGLIIAAVQAVKSRSKSKAKEGSEE